MRQLTIKITVQPRFTLRWLIKKMKRWLIKSGDKMTNTAAVTVAFIQLSWHEAFAKFNIQLFEVCITFCCIDPVDSTVKCVFPSLTNKCLWECIVRVIPCWTWIPCSGIYHCVNVNICAVGMIRRDANGLTQPWPGYKTKYCCIGTSTLVFLFVTRWPDAWSTSSERQLFLVSWHPLTMTSQLLVSFIA